MNQQALVAEISGDPLGRGYSGMSDAEIRVELHTVYRTRNKTSMTGSEVLNSVDEDEWLALADTQRQTAWNVVHLGKINPYGVESTILIGVFGAGSATITALASARVEAITRADEIGVSGARDGDIQRARI